jgi:hypothetical protein
MDYPYVVCIKLIDIDNRIMVSLVEKKIRDCYVFTRSENGSGEVC